MANKFINMIFIITFYIECHLFEYFPSLSYYAIYFTSLYKRVKRQQNKKKQKKGEKYFSYCIESITR